MNYAVYEVKAPEKVETLEAIKDFEVLEKEENTLSIDAGVFIAFCWWAVTYVVNSLVENICNYLGEDSEHDKQKCEDVSLQGHYPKVFDIFGY